MRVSLAKALFVQPKLLLLDDPTNHLDLAAVLWLDTYLSEFPGTLLCVSHDAAFLDSVCTDMLVLQDRRLHQYRGGYTKSRQLRDEATAKAHAARVAAFKKQQSKLAALKKKLKSAEAAIKQVLYEDGMAELLKQPKEYSVRFSFDSVVGYEDAGIAVSDVRFSYSGAAPWLLGADFGFGVGSRVALVGPNGAGKSTTLGLMARSLDPCEGAVHYMRGVRVAQYHQHFDELLPLHRTPVEYLAERFNLSREWENRKELVKFNLPAEVHHSLIRDLSGGQKARLAFAALFLAKPHVLILDEPTNHLDIETIEALTHALDEFAGGVMIVSHDERLLKRLLKSIDAEIWVCDQGTVGRFGGDFDAYRDAVLREVWERERVAEVAAKRLAEERAAKRLERQRKRKG